MAKKLCAKKSYGVTHLVILVSLSEPYGTRLKRNSTSQSALCQQAKRQQATCLFSGLNTVIAIQSMKGVLPSSLIKSSRTRLSPSQTRTLPQAYISSGCRLPPCDTEVFAGDYLRWPTFRDLFTAIYINNPRLTPVEKLFHLNAKTSADAHAIVSISPLTNEGFRSAWENLIERFEKKTIVGKQSIENTV